MESVTYEYSWRVVPVGVDVVNVLAASYTHHARLATAVFMTKDVASLAASVLPPILQAFSQHVSPGSPSREWQSGQSSFMACEHDRDIPIWSMRTPCGQSGC